MRWVKGEGLVARTCAACGAPFQIERWKLKKFPCLYCSKACMGVGQRGKRLSSFAPLDELQRLYIDDQQTLQQIASRYGVTLQAVAWQLEKIGVSRRPSTHDPQWLHTPEVRAKTAAAAPRGERNHNWHAIPTARIVELYATGLSSVVIGQQLDLSAQSVLRSLASSGVPRRDAGFPRYRTAHDGHRVQSAWEMLLDDWLSEHGIAHQVHPLLPFSRQQRADFLCGDTYIELWGVTHNAAYAQRRDAKIVAYRAHSIPLIEVWPHHIVREDFAPLKVLL